MKRLTIGAAVACALFALAFFANLARADRVDAMSENVMVYCSNAADIFRQGVWARTVGIARRIEQTPAGLTLPHSRTCPWSRSTTTNGAR